MISNITDTLMFEIFVFLFLLYILLWFLIYTIFVCHMYHCVSLHKKFHENTFTCLD